MRVRSQRSSFSSRKATRKATERVPDLFHPSIGCFRTRSGTPEVLGASVTLICPTHRTLRPCRVGEKIKGRFRSGLPGKDRSCEKTTSESRRSAHALKGWGAVSGPPCDGRLSPKVYGPVRRYRSGREVINYKGRKLKMKS